MDGMGKKSPTAPTFHGPRKTPEYLIHSLEGNLLNGVRWDSVSFTFTDGFLLDKMMYINSRGET